MFLVNNSTQQPKNSRGHLTEIIWDYFKKIGKKEKSDIFRPKSGLDTVIARSKTEIYINYFL